MSLGAKLIYQSEAVQYTELRLDAAGLTLGSAITCEIRTSDVQVSQRHCWIGLREDAWWVEDLNSTHGTLLNGVPVNRAAPLSHMDGIQCGEMQVHFLLVEIADEEALLSDERSLSDEGAAADLRLAEVRQIRDELLRQLDQTEAKLYSAEKENGQLRGQVQELRAERSLLSRRFDEAIDAARTQKEALETASAALGEAHERLAKQQGEMAQLRDQGADLAQARRVADEVSAKLHRQVEVLAAQVAAAAKDRDAALAEQRRQVAEEEERQKVLVEQEKMIAQQRLRVRELEAQVESLRQGKATDGRPGGEGLNAPKG